MKKNAGFTLIELIAVIVILGILAATALPRFVDLSDAAEQAAVDGVAGNIGSAMALNYAAAVANSSGFNDQDYTVIDDCEDGSLLLLSGLPTGYLITPTAIPAPMGTVVNCTLTYAGRNATFQGISAP